METIIVYMSKHGTTEKAAVELQKHLGRARLCNLKKEKPDLRNIDTVIIGGSIHAGKMQKKLHMFLHRNMPVLLQKKLGLFLCCMDEKKAEEQFNASFNEELRSHAAAMDVFGGEFIFENMNFFERKIVEKVAGTSDSISKLDMEKIKKFASAVKN